MQRHGRFGMINSSFWHGKRVLVTGHTGFKGGWLTLWLNMLGAKVYGFSLPPIQGHSFYKEVSLTDYCSGIFGDIRDYDTFSKYIFDVQPEVIFHLAAQPLVRYSYIYPLETISTNVIGVANLLQASRSVESIQAIVNVTTDKCYENKEWFWPYRESDRLGGQDPYSCSKSLSELLTSSFRKSFFEATPGVAKPAIATARSGNVIGGGDWSEDRLVPDLMRAHFGGKRLIIKNPSSVRPWQHVFEPLTGYLLLAQALCVSSPKYSTAWNFGPREDTTATVGDVINLFQLFSNEKINIDLHPDSVYESKLLKLDSSKARAELAWKNVWDLNESVRHTWSWYQKCYQGFNMTEISLKQLEKYLLASTSGA